MPGYGFSGKPTTTGWGPESIARAWAVLMKRLGYTRYVAQGGDWGGQVTDQMGAQAPPELLGIHTNFPGAVRDDVTAAVLSGGAPPAGLDAEETRVYEKLKVFWATDVTVCAPDGDASTDAVRNRGFTHRPGGLYARPRRDQLGADRTRLRRTRRGPDTRRRPRQRHALLVDEHGDFFGSSLCGKQVVVFRPEGRVHPGCRERLSRRDVSSRRGVGWSRRIPS